MPQNKPKIERYEVVTARGPGVNQYGDLVFSDSEGKSYKIGNKRPQLFDQIIDGRAVKLGWAIYTPEDGTRSVEYIASAELYDGQPAQPTPGIPESRQKTPLKKDRDAQITESMWYKELGECIRTGTLEKQWPKTCVRITNDYFREMAKQTGIKFGE